MQLWDRPSYSALAAQHCCLVKVMEAGALLVLFGLALATGSAASHLCTLVASLGFAPDFAATLLC
jgi:hypothetical protein